MGFLAAPLLWALAAVAIPVLVHLLGRPKPLPHRFPALRFILRSQRSSARALRLKHLLVLLLRIVAVALVVLALARPLCGGGTILAGWAATGALLAVLAAWALPRREFAAGALALLILGALCLSYPRRPAGARPPLQGDFVLIMDQSLSMSYVEPGGPRFDLARRQALQLLERLAPDARLALILATERAERAQGRLSYRHDIVRQRLMQAGATGRGLDLAPALQGAREALLRDHAGGPAAVVLFTDLQANAVQALLARPPGDSGLPGAPKLPLLVVDVGSDQARNGAALAASLPGSVVPADTAATLTGRVRPVDRNRPCVVELYVDERRVAQKLLQPSGQDTLEVELDFQAGPAGTHRGRLHLPDSDRLPMDQDFMFVYEAGRPASILILEAPGNPHGTAFFLRAALQPYSRENAPGSSGLVCAEEPAGELSAEKLARHRVVVLADCGPLSDASWTTLQRWANEGGGLFVWLGPHTSAAQLRRYGFQEYASHAGLLPGHIGAPAVLATPETIVLTQPEHPLLARFSPGVAALLREALVRRCVLVAPEPRDSSCNVVLQLSGGSALLLEKTYGRGRVVLCAMGPGLECSDLPRRGEAFVTLVLDSVRLLAGGEGELRARLGFPLVLALPSPPRDGQVLWLQPGAVAPATLRVDSSPLPVLAAGPAQPAAAQATVIVPPLEAVGVHEFRWQQAETGAALTRLVAVNPETSESDLAKASRETLTQACAAWAVSVVGDINASSLLGGAENVGRDEATAGVLLALLGLLLAESFLANRLYRVEVEPEAAVAPAARAAHGESHGAA